MKCTATARLTTPSTMSQASTHRQSNQHVEMRARAASLLAILAAVALTALMTLLSTSVLGLPPLGTLLDPVDGLYRQARLMTAVLVDADATPIPGLKHPVEVYFDSRGVPHIYGEDDLDVVRAFGYVVARDRLFQMDFIGRVASGRLSTLVGSAGVETDRFLRRTGMEMGVRLNADRVLREQGEELAFIEAYCEGVNAFVDGLSPADYPIEYRLLGAAPERCTVELPLRIAQYMAYDLSFQSDDAAYGIMRKRIGDDDYAELFGQTDTLYVPIVPDALQAAAVTRPSSGSAHVRNRWIEMHRVLAGTPVEGFVHGKGSNNWAVSGARSTTGAPILAGDMHLSLSLPAIWYEARLSGPTLNLYGVTVPGAPLPIQSFTESIGWAFTNTGSDQIDHYRLELDSTKTRYRYNGQWRPLRVVEETIEVKGAKAVTDTVFVSHWGPVMMDEEPVAIRWTAHAENRALEALIRMSRATDLASFDAALESWHAPMQNILYADRHGTIAIRSTGRFPLRANRSGAGVFDGSNDDGAWSGYIPFGALPHAVNPAAGYLSSTNQNPVAASYPYYLGHDWRPGYRSIRIDELLRARDRHSPEDIARYQSDVFVVQHRLFFPFFDTLTGVEGAAAEIREMLRRWNGHALPDRPEPLAFRYLFDELKSLTWDEGVFVDGVTPSESVLHRLLAEGGSSKWFDRESTEETESGADILRMALESAARRLEADHGADREAWRWGDFNRVLFRHITRSEALRPFWRGPFEYGGFANTLSPATGTPVVHSASWRVVLDFSTSPPRARGIYPGGQSGNPLDATYDGHLDDYLNFRYYPLEMPRDPAEHSEFGTMRRLTFTP